MSLRSLRDLQGIREVCKELNFKLYVGWILPDGEKESGPWTHRELDMDRQDAR